MGVSPSVDPEVRLRKAPVEGVDVFAYTLTVSQMYNEYCVFTALL